MKIREFHPGLMGPSGLKAIKMDPSGPNHCSIGSMLVSLMFKHEYRDLDNRFTCYLSQDSNLDDCQFNRRWSIV